MSGTVGVVADATARYTIFAQSITTMFTPPNTAIDWRIGADRGRSRNSLVAASLERGSEWMLFLDDDHSFPPDILQRLLLHEQPVVASLYLQRADPFLPLAYTSKKDGDYWPLDLDEHGKQGLVPVIGAGTGGMLIRSEVFHHLDPPWFIHTTQQSEDLYFCDRCVEAGIPIFVDLAARLGHVAAVNVYPDYIEADGRETWSAGLAISPTAVVHLPILMPLPAEETSA
jgi:hypothetical protein